MQQDPLISVIVPAYNAIGTIRETLASVLEQTYRNIEVIVVDDGSTDETADIVRALSETDNRIKLVTQPNGGVAAARNTGIEAAQGAYIAPVDADDVWHPDNLVRKLDVLMEDESIGLVYSYYRLIDAESRVTLDSHPVDCDGWLINRHLYFNFVGNGSNLLAKRSVVVEAGGYDKRLKDMGLEGCEDFLLQLKIAARYKVGLSPYYLVGYRQADGTMSKSIPRMQRSELAALDTVERERPGVPRAAVKLARVRVLVLLAILQQKRRRWRDMAQALAEAAAIDAIGTYRLASWRASQSLLRKLTRKKRHVALPNFRDCVPDWQGEYEPTPMFPIHFRLMRQLDEIYMAGGKDHAPDKVLAG